MAQRGAEEKREKPKKAASLTMRLTRRTRDALEEAAKAEGRSISEMAERWLDLAARGKADFEGRAGGGAMGETMLTMVAFVHALADDVAANNPELAGVDPTADIGVRAALVSGVGRLMALVYPIRAHGSSTPDPQALRHELQRACVDCQNELRRIMAPPDATGDLEAFGTLDNCVIGGFSGASLARLRDALERIGGLGDVAFQASVETASTALANYDEARSRELDWLARWSARGRNLADAMATNELRYRMLDQAREAESKWPGSPFVGGALRRFGEASTESLMEREQAIVDRAPRLYPESLKRPSRRRRASDA